MSAVRKVIFLLSLTLIAGAWGRYATLEGARATPAIPASVFESPLVASAEQTADTEPADAPPIDIADAPRIDIYGNPIDDAAGDYRLDSRGDLYESHSPETAILALGPPGV